MWISKNFLPLLVPLATSLFITQSKAAPFQSMVVGSFGQSETSYSGGGGQDADVIGLTGVYYLRSVAGSSGPLFELPFLDKSAYVSGGISRNNFEGAGDSDVLDLNARFVTQEAMIFELGYLDSNFNDDGGSKILDFGLGKYLGDRTTAVLYYSTQDDGVDFDTFGVRYKNLQDGSTGGTYLTYEVGLDYVDSADDSGFQFIFDGVYFLSRISSLGVNLGFVDIGEFDSTVITLTGRHFFTDNLFGSLAYETTSRSSNTDTDLIAIQVGARF